MIPVFFGRLKKESSSPFLTIAIPYRIASTIRQATINSKNNNIIQLSPSFISPPLNKNYHGQNQTSSSLTYTHQSFSLYNL